MQTISKPSSDAAYLEASSRIIFMGGLNRQVVDNKWAGFLDAFKSFDIEYVAGLTPSDLDRLAEDERLIRYRAKLAAVITNAGTIESLAKEHGSFQAYVDGICAEKGIPAAAKALAKQFKYVSEQGATYLLYSTGYDIGEVSAKNQMKYAPYQA